MDLTSALSRVSIRGHETLTYHDENDINIKKSGAYINLFKGNYKVIG